MKVILTGTQENLGRVGDVLEVAQGYAVNFLIPKGLAVQATRGNLKHWEEKTDGLRKKEEKAITSIVAIKDKLEAEPLTFKAHVGKNEKLYGSITVQNIADMIKEKLDIEIDRKKIVHDDNLKVAGSHTVKIKLHPVVVANVNLIIEGEEEIVSSEEPERSE